ncbi:hypothetical protein D3C71_1926070 [compost metagenome]
MFEQGYRCQQRLHPLPITIDQLRQFLALRGAQMIAEIALHMHQYVGVVTTGSLVRQQFHQATAVFEGEGFQRIPFIDARHKTPKLPVFLLRMRIQRQLLSTVKGD